MKSEPETAVPVTVVYATVTSWLLAGLSVTVKTASPPSATAAASPIFNMGRGSASILPAPTASVTLAPFGLLNSTVKFSLGSAVESLRIGTRTVWVVSFGSNRSVPEVVV